MEHQIPNPLFSTKNISKNEKGGPLERTLSLEKPSPIATTHLKIEIVWAHYPLTPSSYKMCTKLREKGFKCLSLLTPRWHINEENHLLVGIDIQRPL